MKFIYIISLIFISVSIQAQKLKLALPVAINADTVDEESPGGYFKVGLSYEFNESVSLGINGQFYFYTFEKEFLDDNNLTLKHNIKHKNRASEIELSFEYNIIISDSETLPLFLYLGYAPGLVFVKDKLYYRNYNINLHPNFKEAYKLNDELKTNWNFNNQFSLGVKLESKNIAITGGLSYETFDPRKNISKLQIDKLPNYNYHHTPRGQLYFSIGIKFTLFKM